MFFGVAVYTPEEVMGALNYNPDFIITAPGLVQSAGVVYLMPMRELAGMTPFIIDLGQLSALGVAALAAGFKHLVLDECLGFSALQSRVENYAEARLYNRQELSKVFPLYAELVINGEKIAYQNLQKWLLESQEI